LAERFPTPQRGIALITVLLVVALASLTATSLASMTQFGLRRSSLLQQEQQARLYLHGAEQWAAQILNRDRGDGPVDHLDEDWARTLPPLPVEGGQVSGRLSDLQGRFNLNSLIIGETVDEARLAVLERLLDQLGLNRGIALAIADWIDADREPRFPDGAEDSDYLTRNPAYLAANRPLTSVSELLLIRGVDGAVHARLAPLVSALPRPTPINVNTAPVEVLAALDSGLDQSAAMRLDQARREQPFASVDEFIASTGLVELDIPQGLLTTGSDFFLLEAEAGIGDASARLHSLLYRADSGATRSLMRSYGASL
jgi:general secretion pathway protein K